VPDGPSSLELSVPKHVAPLLEQAQRLQRAGDRNAAEGVCSEIIAREPGCAAAWLLWSGMAMDARDDSRALELLRRATQAVPRSALFPCNAAEVHRRLGQLDEASSLLERALELDPSFATAHRNLGVVRQQQGDTDRAMRAYQRALELQPDLPGCAHRLVEVFRAKSEFEQAIAVFKRSITRTPRSVDLLLAGANALADVYRLDEALVQFERALEVAPETAKVHASLGAALADAGRVPEALEHYRRAASLEPARRVYRGAIVYLLPYVAGTTPAQVLEEARRYAELFSEVEPLPSVAATSPDRRLRVGYVSADFCRHAEAHFTLPLFRHHDRRAVELFAYSNVMHPDDITRELRQLSDGWCDISRLNDEQVAARVREARVDVLVDLSMHTGRTRLPVFARKPAPLQFTWLAYPGTTGLASIDCRLTDVHLDPPGEHDADYVEKSVRLPATFWCYDPLASVPVNAAPCLNGGTFTFGCLNNFRKVTSTTLELWARVLGTVSDAKLRMVAPQGRARAGVRRAFEEHGVEGSRIEFVDHRPRTAYLEEYHRIDCCLDTVPYNGGTTSLDAFWMGVPVVTLAGATVTARSGRTIATNLGLPELVAQTKEEFVARAATLATDRSRLATLRTTLRARMEQSPLMDAPSFARNVEAAYRREWVALCNAARVR